MRALLYMYKYLCVCVRFFFLVSLDGVGGVIATQSIRTAIEEEEA